MSQRNRFFILLAVLFTIALTFYFLTTNRSTEVVLIGTVDANQVIVSSNVPGRIEKLAVEEGQTVKAGELVATIDGAPYATQKAAAAATLASLRSQVASSRATFQSTEGDTKNTVANAQATVQAAKATLKAAIANRDLQASVTRRTVALAAEGVASQQDRDQAANALRANQAQVQAARDQVRAAEAALRVAEARTNQAKAALSTVGATKGQMNAAQAQLDAADVQLGYTKIFAPISGKIDVRVARPGEVVTVGAPIATIIDLTQTWVYAPVPETYADAVGLGDVLTVKMPSGKEIPGKVIAKLAEGDFATQRDVSRTKRDIKTVQIKLLIDNPKMDYVPGMTAEVLLPKSKLVKP